MPQVNQYMCFTEIRQRKRRTSNSCWPVLTLSALLIFGFLLAWSRLIVFISGVEFLALQEVTENVPLKGILVKEELVIRSPVNGKIHFMAGDGNRLEMGAPAAEVIAMEGGGVVLKLVTPAAGMFCTHLDGLETILTPANLDVLDFSSLDRISYKHVSEGDRVEKGQAVFKLVDNLSPTYFYAEAVKEGFPADLPEKPRWLKAAWDNHPLMIKALKINETEDGWEGLFQLSNFPDELVHNRKVDLNITTNLLAGLLVPQHAVVYRDETPGLYLAIKKRAQWVPVKIEGDLNGKVAISGRGLGENTRYVSNPALIREGSLVE